MCGSAKHNRDVHSLKTVPVLRTLLKVLLQVGAGCCLEHAAQQSKQL
jgi:hypothetical protein